MDLDPRVFATVGLLALVPAAVYAATQPDQIGGVVAAINVVLIVASIAIAVGPVERGVAWG